MVDLRPNINIPADLYSSVPSTGVANLPMIMEQYQQAQQRAQQQQMLKQQMMQQQQQQAQAAEMLQRRRQQVQQIQGLAQQNPQLAQLAPFINEDNVNQMGPQIGAQLIKGQKSPNSWRVIPGQLSPGGKSLLYNEQTGETKEGVFGAAPLSPKGGSGSDISKITWDTASPDMRNLAIGVYNGNIRPHDLGYRDKSIAVVLANEYATKNGLPPFQSFGGDTKAATAKAFTSGKQGTNALALNTALGHLKSANDAFQKMGNSDVTLLNKPINELKKRVGDKNVYALVANMNALRGELATVFKGSGATDQEIKNMEAGLSENQSPAQFMETAKKLNELMNSRLSALQFQRNQGMSNRPGSGPLLSPEAARESASFGSGPAKGQKDPLGIF